MKWIQTDLKKIQTHHNGKLPINKKIVWISIEQRKWKVIYRYCWNPDSNSTFALKQIARIIFYELVILRNTDSPLRCACKMIIRLQCLEVYESYTSMFSILGYSLTSHYFTKYFDEQLHFSAVWKMAASRNT